MNNKEVNDSKSGLEIDLEIDTHKKLSQISKIYIEISLSSYNEHNMDIKYSSESNTIITTFVSLVHGKNRHPFKFETVMNFV